jgi:hypothetical protein
MEIDFLVFLSDFRKSKGSKVWLYSFAVKKSKDDTPNSNPDGSNFLFFLGVTVHFCELLFELLTFLGSFRLPKDYYLNHIFYGILVEPYYRTFSIFPNFSESNFCSPFFKD